MKRPSLETERTRVLLLPPSEAERVAQYNRDNRAHFAAWEPVRPAGFYQASYWRERLAHNIAEYDQDRAARLWIVTREGGDLVGTLNFNHFVRGALQACTLGYGVDHRYEGKGYMFEALSAAIEFAFDTLHMHRIMANYMPHNERSARLLERLGFEIEGRARDYLYIAGTWRDHVLTSLINRSHSFSRV